MPKAHANGIDLYYEVSGEGEPLVFIPGLAGTTDLWLYQTSFFKDRYRVISLDNRGAGRSDMPDGPYSMQQFAKDLHDLLEVLEVNEPVNLVGASMGGLIAQAFIHDYPQRVKKLVLACSGVSGGDPHITFAAPEVAQRIGNPGATAEEKVQTYLDIFYHADFVAANPQLRQFFLSRKVDAQPPQAYQAQLAACSDPRPYYDWLADIQVPTLVMHGDEDLIWPLQNAHTLVAGTGGRAQLYVMEKAGHIFMHEQPLAFNQALDAFLRQP
jgi:pimeloyl-ACP methyl ester carboxylesterase